MKHAVSVAELLELHRLGELYLKWTATPFAISEDDLQELQEISDRYSINHSSALFSFQRQYQREMAVGVERTIDRAIEAIPGLAEALKMVPTTPLVEESTAYEQFANAGEHLDRPLLPAEAGFLQEAMDRAREPEEVRDHRQAAFQKAAELRAFREQLDGEMNDAREVEILRDISNVDDLTEEESERLDHLVERMQLEQDAVISPRSKSIPIPSGVVQDAITTGHIEKIR